MERHDLIRPQVLLHRRQGNGAAIVVSQSRAMATLLWIMSLLVVALITVLFFIRYKQTAPALGLLEAVVAPAKIVSPVAAQVSQLLVKEGQRVRAGDTLAILSTEVFDGAGLRAEQISIKQLEVKTALLRKERTLASKIYQTSARRIEASIDVIQLKHDKLKKSVSLSQERLALASANLKSFSTLLESANVSTLQHNQQQLSHLDAAQYANDMEFSRLESESKLAELKLEQEALELQYLAKMAEHDEQLHLLENEIVGLRNSHLVRIQSSADGVVSGLAVQAGMALFANQYLMEIADPENQLLATLFVPSSIVGKLHTEQELKLAFDTFPVSEYGYTDARILEIGGSPLDPRHAAIPIQISNQPVFKVIATLDKNFVEGPETYPLKRGYGFTAQFVTEDLSLIEFVFKPLLALRAKSL